MADDRNRFYSIDENGIRSRIAPAPLPGIWGTAAPLLPYMRNSDDAGSGERYPGSGPESFFRDGIEYARGYTPEGLGPLNAWMTPSTITDPEFGFGLPVSLLNQLRWPDNDSFFDKFGPMLGLAGFALPVAASLGALGAGSSFIPGVTDVVPGTLGTGAGIGGELSWVLPEGAEWAGETVTDVLQGGGMDFLNNPLTTQYVNPTASITDMINAVSSGGGVSVGGLGTLAQQAELAAMLGLSPEVAATLGAVGSGTGILGQAPSFLGGSGALPSIMDWAGLGSSLGASFDLTKYLPSLDKVPGALGSLGSGGLGGIGDLAGRLGPGLLALQYARNTNPLDTSRLESLYNEASDPNLNPALLRYDLETGRGRERLTSSLTNRGIMGSSFGNFDLNSYDTLRGLGRGSLLGEGLRTRTQLASNILDAQARDQALKNQLYGRAFDVLGRGLSPGPSLYLGGGTY